MRAAVLLVCLFGLVLPACIGDQSRDVVLVNDTGESVTVFPYGLQQSQFKHVLAPGGRATENVLTGSGASSTFVAYVEAVNNSGSLIFCRRYSVGQLQQLGWLVRLKSGELNCSASGG